MTGNIARVEDYSERGGKMRTISSRFVPLGTQAIHQVNNLLREGNAHQMIVRECDGPVLLAIPLTFGVIGAFFFILFARFRWTILVTLISLFFRIQIVVEPPLQPVAATPDRVLPASPKRRSDRT